MKTFLTPYFTKKWQTFTLFQITPVCVCVCVLLSMSVSSCGWNEVLILSVSVFVDSKQEFIENKFNLKFRMVSSLRKAPAEWCKDCP